jgi:hypothetical protein
MTKYTSNPYKWAMEYHKMGLKVVPLCWPLKDECGCPYKHQKDKVGKVPLIKWQRYIDKPQTEKEVHNFFAKYPRANIGLITGDKFVVLDIDGEKGLESVKKALPSLLDYIPLEEGERGKIENNKKTPVVKTGKGWHLYFRKPNGIKLKGRVDILPGLDLRAQGNYIVAPPSIHQNGETYQWIFDLDYYEFREFPKEVLELLKVKKEALTDKGKNRGRVIIKTDTEKFLKEGVKEGNRHNACVKLAGCFLGKSFDKRIVKILLLDWNKKNRPPLPEKEVIEIIESIDRKEKEKRRRGRKTKEESLIELVKERFKLFHYKKTGFACLYRNSHKEIWPVKSEQFKQRLYEIYKEEKNEFIGEDVLRDATNKISREAISQGEINLFNRVGKIGEDIYFDLANDKWEGVKITKEGWETVKLPILFRRYNHQLPQTYPVDGDLDLLWQFLNIDIRYRLLLACWLISCFIPEIPHPILVLHGDPGSGKTFALTLLSRLIDPSRAEKVAPREEDIHLILEQHWFFFWDNASSISGSTSDIFSKAATGDSQERRKLFTDEDTCIFNYKRCIGITSISNIITREDLLDRAILISTQRIKNFKPEKKLFDNFEACKPKILGGIFDILSKAMRKYNENQEEDSEEDSGRMRDFILWGKAIATAMGYTPEDFMGVYKENIKRQTQEAINASNVATAIVDFMEDKEEWIGTAGDLLRELDPIREKHGISKKPGFWPQAPHALSRILRRARVHLENMGLKIEFATRKIMIRKTQSNL